MSRGSTWVLIGVVAGLWATSPAQAQEAAEPADQQAGGDEPLDDWGAGQESAPAAEPAAEATPSAPSSPAPAAASGESSQQPMTRLGRVEMVLVQNNDPESALEFVQEIVNDGEDSPQVSFLRATCLFRLERFAEAAALFGQVAASPVPPSDAAMHLHALYNKARALQAAGEIIPAADAYSQYATEARAQSELTGFVAYAETAARNLRARPTRSSRPSR